MTTSVKYVPHKEFSVRIENLSLKLLVVEPIDTRYVAEGENLYHIMHDHATCELFVCGEGDMFIQFKNGTIKLSGGEAAIIPKGVLHTRRPDTKDARWHALSFLCSKVSFGSSSDLYRELSPIADCEKVIIFRNAEGLFERAEKILELSKDSPEALPAIHMAELLIDCLRLPRELFEGSDDDSDSDVSDRENDLNRLAKLDQLVYNNYMQNITAEEIAERLFISSRQLDRIARKRYGKPLHRVIMDRRIAAAEKMLLDSDMTVDKICAAVGFGSRSGFYREFERKHGMTPAEYRKKNR